MSYVAVVCTFTGCDTAMLLHVAAAVVTRGRSAHLKQLCWLVCCKRQSMQRSIRVHGQISHVACGCSVGICQCGWGCWSFLSGPWCSVKARRQSTSVLVAVSLLLQQASGCALAMHAQASICCQYAQCFRLPGRNRNTPAGSSNCSSRLANRKY